MFTGLITDLGRVRRTEARGDTRFEIETAYDTATIAIGASIACSGACLTAIELGPDWFAVEASAETLSRTTLGQWQVGDSINLERSLKLGDELGGHLVSGHVDAVGELVGREPEGDSLRLKFRAPPDLGDSIASKGSIAVNGVSLTVNEVIDESDGATVFGVNIISHTAQVTNLGALAPGNLVNLEIDQLARYLQRMKSRESR